MTVQAADRRLVGGAIVVLVVSTALALGGVSDVERRIFAWANGLPDGGEWPIGIPMLLGHWWLVPPVALVVGMVARSRRVAAAVLAAGLAAWGVTSFLKWAVDRGRPAFELAEVELRDGPFTGYHSRLGFPSGHAGVSMAVATVLALVLPAVWRVVPVVVAAIVAFGRLYFGAHLPLDIVGGAAVGVLCALAAWAVVHRIPEDVARRRGGHPMGGSDAPSTPVSAGRRQ